MSRVNVQEIQEFPPTYMYGFHEEDEVRKMKYTKCGNTNMVVSQLSFGTAGFSYLFGGYDLDQCKATVMEALKRGINFIDTAPFYGYGISETVLGKCFEGIPRLAYYIATKVGRYDKDPKYGYDFTERKTRDSLETSFKRLGLDQIDVIQVQGVEHAPKDVLFKETLPVLEEFRQEGKIKHIGITGYSLQTLADIITESPINIDTVMTYSRLSLLDQSLTNFLPLFKSHNLMVINAAPHCMGLFNANGPKDDHRACQEIKDVCAEAREYCAQNEIEIEKLATYFSVEQKGPDTTLIAMNNNEVLRKHLETYQNGLDENELKVYDYVKNTILSKLTVTHWE